MTEVTSIHAPKIMKELSYVVNIPYGLHARPAAQIAQCCSGVKSTVMLQKEGTGKTIIPFCSHGGGRFGQSLTAIAKLAPDAVIGEGLSVHYSGGASLSSDVTAWLKTNGIGK